MLLSWFDCITTKGSLFDLYCDLSVLMIVIFFFLKKNKSEIVFLKAIYPESYF